MRWFLCLLLVLFILTPKTHAESDKSLIVDSAMCSKNNIYYCSIQEAIEDSDKGSKIQIKGDKYSERLRFDTNNSYLTLEPLDSAEVVISQPADKFIQQPLVHIDGAKFILIQDITFEDSSPCDEDYTTVVITRNGKATFANNRFVNKLNPEENINCVNKAGFAIGEGSTQEETLLLYNLFRNYPTGVEVRSEKAVVSSVKNNYVGNKSSTNNPVFKKGENSFFKSIKDSIVSYNESLS